MTDLQTLVRQTSNPSILKMQQRLHDEILTLGKQALEWKASCEALQLALETERDALAGRVAELEAERDRSRRQFVDVSVAFMSFVPESEAAAKGLLQKLGDAHGYGWCQQALGEMWDVKHDCAPRGSMGVTVGKCNPPKLWTKRSQDAYRKGWNDHAALSTTPESKP